MRKTTFFCDRCGKMLSGKAQQLGVRDIDTETGGAEIDGEWGAELCPECYRMIDDMIAFVVKNKMFKFSGGKLFNMAGAHSTGGAHNAKPLDMGKVFALRRAGWTLDKIGEEFGVSAQTVSNQIKKYEAQKDALKDSIQEDLKND